MGDAILSPCGTYRYWLSRELAGGDPERWATFIMLNPSTADATADDPTVRRCLGFAAREGCGALQVVNLFALRATDPAALKGHSDPVGPENDAAILFACKQPGVVVCAWGVHGTLAGRDQAAVALLRKAGVRLFALGWTSRGHPRHPLYLPADAPLEPFPEPKEAGR